MPPKNDDSIAASDIEAWKARGKAALANAEKEEQPQERAQEANAAATELQEWVAKAQAETEYDERVLLRLARKLTGTSGYERSPAERRRSLRRMFLLSLLPSTAFFIGILFAPFLQVGIAVLAATPLFFGWMFYDARKQRRKAYEEFKKTASVAIESAREWAQRQSLHLQNLADLVYIGPACSWYRLIICFKPGHRPVEDDVVAMITGLLNDIEPLKVSVSLSVDLPEMRVDIEHRKHEHIQPEAMRRQLERLVERGLPALHKESPILCVRFGTLKSSIHS